MPLTCRSATIANDIEPALWDTLTRTFAATCMLIRMQSTSVRIDATTHDELKRLATELDTTVGNTVALAVRALRQDHIGSDLTESLRDDESDWLDAELG